ncbi:S-layer homology domain-containing protein [Bacillus thermotolerans]|uniref:S-layer homology domain-containing protein n=1 Tax=Bacillus thermotolerans TaxID=1221996 RepID=UPI00059194D7|nr:S-layer homology domain-containing protein [Bacillus thermotolerans]KKB34768.1 Transporter [Bacillus thermotolerans]
MKLSKKMSTAVVALLLSGGVLATPANAEDAFSDVSSGYWAYSQIEGLADKGIVTGFKDGTFRSAEIATRAQSAIFIGRAVNVDTSETGSVAFKDISPRSTVAYPYIAGLTERGVYAEEEQFHPNRELTRADLAHMLVKAFNLPIADNASFTDVPDSHWAAEDIRSIAAAGIISGTSATTFSPNKPVTRGELSVFINNALNYSPQNGQNEEVTVEQSGQAQEVDNHSELEQQILKLVNEERAKAGAPALTLAEDISKVAQKKSEDMAEKDYFDHNSPTYGSPFAMMEQFGLDYTLAGENIAAGYQSASAVMEDWMDSPGHRANILNPGYKEIGIGIANGGEYGTYYTQMFIAR